MTKAQSSIKVELNCLTISFSDIEPKLRTKNSQFTTVGSPEMQELLIFVSFFLYSVFEIFATFYIELNKVGSINQSKLSLQIEVTEPGIRFPFNLVQTDAFQKSIIVLRTLQFNKKANLKEEIYFFCLPVFVVGVALLSYFFRRESMILRFSKLDAQPGIRSTNRKKIHILF